MHRNSGGILDVVTEIGAGQLRPCDRESVTFSGELGDAATEFHAVMGAYVHAVERRGIENVMLMMPVRRGKIDEPGLPAIVPDRPGPVFAGPAQPAVVNGLQFADQARLEQQRAELTRRLGPLDVPHLRRESLRLGIAPCGHEVGQHAFAQVVGLADIDQRARLAEEPVHARRLGQLVHELGRNLRGQRRSARDRFERRVESLRGPLCPHRAPELRQHLGIRQRPVPRRAGQPVPRDHGIQVVASPVGIEMPGQTHGAGHGRGVGAPCTTHLGTQEAVVETDVVGDETPSREASLDLRGDILETRRVSDHLVADAGEHLDRWGDRSSRVDQRTPLPFDLALAHADDRDLGDAMPCGMSAGGFDVHEGDRRIKGWHAQDRSIQVVFNSVYLSKACSDLSRPMPDCLKPPKGTVMSSAS